MNTENSIARTVTRNIVTVLLAGCVLAMAGCLNARQNPVDPVTNPQGLDFDDVTMETEDYAPPFQRRGQFVSDVRLLKKIAPGVPAAKVTSLLGKPLSQTSGEAGEEWNYHVTVPLPASENYLVCQYKVVFDDQERVKGTVWRRHQCPQLIAQIEPEPKPAPAPVAMPDGDSDGVSDRSDLCADTQSNVQVNGLGCAKGTAIRLSGVHFATDSARLSRDAERILVKAVRALNRVKTIDVEIHGHTDSRASMAHNLDLSQRRANSVRGYLVAHGVDADRLTTEGFGETRPIATNATAQGRARNRRVELHVVK